MASVQTTRRAIEWLWLAIYTRIVTYAIVHPSSLCIGCHRACSGRGLHFDQGSTQTAKWRRCRNPATGSKRKAPVGQWRRRLPWSWKTARRRKVSARREWERRARVAGLEYSRDCCVAMCWELERVQILYSGAERTKEGEMQHSSSYLNRWLRYAEQ